MTTTTDNLPGRLCNQIIRNIFVSILAKNNNLKVNYQSAHNFLSKQLALGIELFSGSNDYNTYITIGAENIFNYINSKFESNIKLGGDIYFQTPECSKYLHKYIQTSLKETIVNSNPYSDRYNNNDDVFIHIRLGDVSQFNPGFEYYDKVLSSLKFRNGYIGTDSPDNSIVIELMKKYNLIIFNKDEVETIQFGSTCKQIILSHGSFSFIIGCFAFYSTIYFPEYDKQKQWYGDMFCIPDWIKIEYLK